MIRWKSTKTETVEVLLQRDYGRITIFSDTPETNALIRSFLRDSYGMFGHQLSTHPTGYDLDYALKSGRLKVFEFKVVEGVVDTPTPIPSNARS